MRYLVTTEVFPLGKIYMVTRQALIDTKNLLTMNYDPQDETKFTVITSHGVPERLETVRCGECHIAVNEIGQLQCPVCFCLYTDEAAKEVFASYHRAVNPEYLEEATNEDWSKIKGIRNLRRNGQHEKLRIERYVYKDLEGKVVDSRYCYELRN